MTTSTVSFWRARRFALPVAALLIMAMALRASEPTPTAAPAPSPDTHILFMGADLLLPMDKQVYPVEAVTVSSILIMVDGEPMQVPYLRVVDVNIKEALKLSRASVGIAGLKVEQAYTEGADPFTQMNKAEALVLAQGAMTDVANVDLARAEADLKAAASMGAGPGERPTPEQVAQRLSAKADAEQAAQRAMNLANADLVSAGAVINQANSLGHAGVFDSVTPSGAPAQMFDAIRVYFTVTADKKLEQPYYAVIAQIRDRGAKPGQVRKWAYVKALGAMSAGEARKVVIYRGGLPPGYHLDSYEVHFYDGNEELATNLSRKRVPLSDDEAQQYRIVEYIGANKGRTLPAAPLTATLPSDVRGQLSAAQLDKTYHVKVAKSGQLTGVFRDAAGEQPLSDATLESALKTLRFKPALEAGKPVEAMAEISPAWLAPQ